MPQVASTPNLQRELADCIIRLAPLDEIRILLACGAKVNDPVTQGLRPLHYAVYQRYIDAIHLLLVRGSDVDAVDEVGYTALHLCAEHGYIDILEILLRHNAKVDWTDHDSLDPYPNTVFADQPLRLAMKNGHYDAAKLLLQNGANPNAHYFQGSEINFIHPLNIEFMELLLTFGADANARDRCGVSPLMKACRHGDGMEAALLLISYGADVNAMTTERSDYRTVLHYGVLSENLQMVNMLIKQGARVTFAPDYRKPTPLDFAILRGSPDMVRMLINAGADVNASSPLIGSPLHIACTENIENQFEILQMLLDNGANPNIYTTSDAGPLLKPPLGEYANLNSKPEVKVVELLLRYGASVILKSQYHDPKGILKALPRLAGFPHVFDVFLEAAESFHLPAIRRARNFVPEQKQMLLRVAETPLQLKHQSRLFLRRQLLSKVTRGVTLPQRIQQLPLPQLIKMYLLYEI
ncbi:hypothetical protein CHUAL_006813 [Chamberlinius hualienensis]